MADKDVVDFPDDFERLLRQELVVEPSPAFAARVRVQMSDDRPAGSWRVWVLSYAAAAVIAVAVLLPLRRGPVTPSAPRVVPQPPLVTTSTPPPVASVGPPLKTAVSRPLPTSTRSAPLVPPATLEQPGVIVDRGQRAALTALIRMVDQGRLTAEAFAQTSPQSMQPIAEQVVPIGVAPVAVSTITSGGVLQNDSERK